MIRTFQKSSERASNKQVSNTETDDITSVCRDGQKIRRFCMTNEQEKVLRADSPALEGGPRAPYLSNAARPGEGPRRPLAMEYLPHRNTGSTHPV